MTKRKDKIYELILPIDLSGRWMGNYRFIRYIDRYLFIFHCITFLGDVYKDFFTMDGYGGVLYNGIRK